MSSASQYRQPKDPRELRRKIAAVSKGGLFDDINETENKIELYVKDPPNPPPSTPSTGTNVDEDSKKAVDPSTVPLPPDAGSEDEEAKRGQALLDEIEMGKERLYKNSECTPSGSDVSMDPIHVCVGDLEQSIIDHIQMSFDNAVNRAGVGHCYPTVIFVKGPDPAILARLAGQTKDENWDDIPPEDTNQDQLPETVSENPSSSAPEKIETDLAACMKKLKEDLEDKPPKKVENVDLKTALSKMPRLSEKLTVRKEPHVRIQERAAETTSSESAVKREIMMRRFLDGIKVPGKHDPNKSITSTIFYRVSI